MDKAKSAINDFMSKSGHHDTTVHETVAPSSVNETVKPHKHEEINTAIDKEVHQDHYHRTVQPVKDREVLPEQHTANLGAVQHREFDRRDAEHTKRTLATEQAAFKDQRTVEGTSHSQSANDAIGGEHVHHHIHETIQPVVHKETIQPHVVHTTVPIHEVHHNAATHHGSSELPAMAMDEFKKKGGVLGGRGERYDGFEGEPKHIGGTLNHMTEGKTSKRDSHHADEQVRHGAMHGDSDPLNGGKHNRHAGRLGENAAERELEHAPGHKTATSTAPGVAGVAGNTRSQTGNVRGVDGVGAVGSDNLQRDSGVTSGTSGAGLEKNPSLMDRVNPMKDTDGDGKKGFMK